MATWGAATAYKQTAWATAYGDALAATPDGDPTTVASGDYGPVPVMASSFLTLAKSGGLEQLISQNFYGGDRTKQLLPPSGGSYLEDQARARSGGGDQWGLMNEAGNYPGQVWLGMMTSWYQIPALGNSDNGDALVWRDPDRILSGGLSQSAEKASRGPWLRRRCAATALALRETTTSSCRDIVCLMTRRPGAGGMA